MLLLESLREGRAVGAFHGAAKREAIRYRSTVSDMCRGFMVTKKLDNGK